jgi:transcription-repair coupling factor (superfamily II helicase)
LVFSLFGQVAAMFKSLEYFVGQKVDLDIVLRDLVAFGYHKTKMVVQESDFAQRGSVVDIFPSNFEGPVRIDIYEDKINSIGSFNMDTGKVIWEHQMVIILPAKQSSRSALFSSETPLNNFVDIERGDYVVHNNHGIGRFLGIQEFNVQEKDLPHLVIEYEGGDKLFVPRHDIHLVQKYISFHKKPPRLYKLGTRAWEAARRKIEKNLQNIAAQLLHTQAARTSLGGFQFSPDTEWQKEFEKKFPFTETPDQLKATEEVKADMESQRPMDRLLCGDVGYGKTEVALRAIFKAVMDNKQVAVLVPTTILAEQHCYNFTKRAKDFPVKVAMLSRFRTKAEQTKIVRDVAEGKVDVVVGTHRLLSKDMAFKNLGLVVIDEEQRFGVKSKERLKQYRLLVDVLTLTATPIPRTLYMALAGARDMSVISTPPQNRVPVSTHIIAFDEKLIKDAIERELRRKGQVFFLHNRVEDIVQVGNIVKRLVGHARVAVAHGQMPGKLLEEIMLQFLGGEIDVLVCTSIIESGIDIPNANTLIINRADRFGLSELHQLRGRVGRMDVKAYAYFVVPPEFRLSTIAKKRLEAIEKHSDLGSGFQIAFEDLQLRGAGNLLGQQQSGFISTIGFDLYCRLLKESIEHLKKKIGVQKHEQRVK